MGLVSAEARDVHAAALIVDLHCDLLLTSHFLGWDWGRRHRPNPLPGAPLMGHGDLPRYHDGNVGCLALGVVVNPLWGGLRQIERDLDRMHQKAAQHPDFVVAGTAQGVRSARAAGRIAGFAGLEGAHGLPSVEVLPGLRARGMRYVGFVHFSKNRYARPMVGWGADAVSPLTADGRALVDACNELGIIIDVAHLNKAGVMEVCRRSKHPVICSHTACRAVHDSPRAIDDEQIRAIAGTGGVVGLIFARPFLGPGGLGRAVEHLDHLRRTVGPAHLGIGTDWEGWVTFPAELSDAAQLPTLTEALLRAGWPAADIHALWGGNFLRVMAEVCDPRG